jgi:hypothetical protein
MAQNIVRYSALDGVSLQAVQHIHKMFCTVLPTDNDASIRC